MDTIIYFYQKRNLEEPLIEPIGQGRYLLVKVAMDVGDCRWFRMRLPAYGKPESPRPENVSKGIFQKWIATLAQCRNRRKQERRQRLWQEAFRQMSGQVETQITKLVRQIGEYVEDWRECRCLYDEAVRKWLVLEEGQEEGRERGWLDGMDSRPYARLRTAGRGETGSLPEGDFAKHWIPRYWQKHWDIPEFADFFSMDWVTPLLSMARLPHFVLLGTAPCVPDVILACAHRMRSLRWVLREKDLTQEILDFVEDFYLDYGLAATLQTLEGDRGFSCKSQVPVCVLDFSGEDRIRPGAVARGSVWLAMASAEKKERCFLGRDSGISYGSMRKSWREARRRAPDWAAIAEAGRHRPQGDQLPQWLREE